MSVRGLFVFCGATWRRQDCARPAVARDFFQKSLAQGLSVVPAPTTNRSRRTIRLVTPPSRESDQVKSRTKPEACAVEREAPTRCSLKTKYGSAVGRATLFAKKRCDDRAHPQSRVNYHTVRCVISARCFFLRSLQRVKNPSFTPLIFLEKSLYLASSSAAGNANSWRKSVISPISPASCATSA